LFSYSNDVLNDESIDMIKYSLLCPISKSNKQKLGLWAAGCADHVLPLFENTTPKRQTAEECHKRIKEMGV